MKLTVTPVLVLALSSLANDLARSTTYVVHADGSGEYATIQAAVNAATDGDEILLTGGTFTGDGNRDVDYLGKAVTIRSESGDPSGCIIDCEGSAGDLHRAFLFASGETRASVLEGVTITGGHASRGAAASCASGTALTFAHCVFDGNVATGSGGAIYSEQSGLLVTGCVFVGNVAERNGGAIDLDDASIPGDATGETASIEHSTFHANTSPTGSVFDVEAPGVTVSNCILAFGRGGGAIWCGGGTPLMTCCDVFGNEGGDDVPCRSDGGGNLSADPMFCDAEAGDLTLRPESPCAPAHSPGDCGLIGAREVGCVDTPVEITSWGRVKSTFGPR